MSLVVVSIAAAVAVGYARGGRLRRLGQARLARPQLVRSALLAQVGAGVASGLGNAGHALGEPAGFWGVHHVLVLLAAMALAGFGWVNRRLPGAAVLTTGLGLNVLVILANGGMPVSGSAVAALGGSTAVAGRHRLLAPGDAFTPLADVIPVPPLQAVVSAGDVLVAVGLVAMVSGLMVAGARAGRGRFSAP